MSKRQERDHAESPSRRDSIASLRSRLARAVREAEAGGTVEITRRGKPVAVLVGREDFDRLRQGGDFWERSGRTPGFADGQIAGFAREDNLTLYK